MEKHFLPNFPRCGAAAVALAFLSAPVLRAAPVLIDNFGVDVPAIQLSDQQDGDMLGGEVDFRFTVVNAIQLAISGGTGVLEVLDDQFNPTLQFMYDGEDNNSTLENFGLEDHDFTDGGTNDRFAVDLSSVSGTFTVQVAVMESGTHYSTLSKTGVTGAGIVEFLFDDFTDTGDGADFTAAQAVYVSFKDGATGDSLEIDSFMARDAALPPEDDPVAPAISAADTVRPAVKVLKRKKLKAPRRRHAIKGKARDNVEVRRVQVKVRGQGGYRKAKLRPSGRWKFRTKPLGSGKTRCKVRAYDTSGNRSKVKSIRVRGR